MHVKSMKHIGLSCTLLLKATHCVVSMVSAFVGVDWGRVVLPAQFCMFQFSCI